MSTLHDENLTDEELEEIALAEAEGSPWADYVPEDVQYDNPALADLAEAAEALAAPQEDVPLGDISDSLTADQREVVETLTGPIVVVAGPGSGKTKTLVERAVNAIRNGAAPRDLLVVTFTRKAANEVRERIAVALGEYRSRDITITTFHGFSGQILRAEGHRIGLNPTYDVLSSSEQKTLVKNLAKQYQLDTEPDYLRLISTAKRNPDLNSTAERVRYLSHELNEQDASTLFAAYEKEKRRLNRLDYDDMIVIAHFLLQLPEVRKVWGHRYRHIQVDEYQDTDGMQHAIVKAVAEGAKSLMAVGDLDQSVYCQLPETAVQVPTADGSATELKPLGTLAVGDRVITYSDGKIDLTGRPITTISREPHDGELVRIECGPNRSLYTCDHHCIIKLGNALAGQQIVYMLKKGDRYRVGQVSAEVPGNHDQFGPSMQTADASADACWVLSVHGAHEGAAQHVAFIRENFGLGGDWSTSNEEKAVATLAHFGLNLLTPFCTGGDAITLRQSFVTAASNVLDGFLMLTTAATHDSQPTWDPVRVTREQYTGDIVSMEVADHHNYFGDGILTHNSWRGAKPELFATFADDFPTAKVLYLGDNFRSTPEILDVAREVINPIEVPYRSELRPNNHSGVQPRIEMTLDQDAEAEYVANWVKDLLGKQTPFKEIAVLFRGRRQSLKLQAALHQAQIPVKMSGGVGFYERKTVKDLLAWFRLAIKPDEMSFRRVVDQMPGIGPKAAQELLDAAEVELDGDISGYLQVYVDNMTAIGKGKQKKVSTVRHITDRLDGIRSTLDTAGIAEALLYALACIPAELLIKEEVQESDLDDIRELLIADAVAFTPEQQLDVEEANEVYHYAHGRGIMMDPDEETGEVRVLFYDFDENHPGVTFDAHARDEEGVSTVPVAAQVLTLAGDEAMGDPVPPPVEFLQQVSLDNQALAEAAGGAIELSTIHAAKGREWDHVCVMGLVDGLFPGGFGEDKLIEPTAEERRVMFVAVSRARKSLLLTTYRSQRLRDGGFMRRHPSIFLYELQDAGVCQQNRPLPPKPTPRRSGGWRGGGLTW